MKFESATISQFKGITYKHIPSIPKRTIFTGKNGSGKTSAMEALRYAITGDAPDNCIRSGASNADVSVVLGTGDQIERMPTPSGSTKPSKIKYNGTLTTQKSVNEMLKVSTGLDVATMKVMTSGELLEAMNGGQLSDFLTSSGLLPVNVDVDELSALCGLSSEAAFMAGMYLPPMPNKFGLDVITDAYKTFYDERAVVTREIKEAEIKSKFEGAAPIRDIAAIDKEIAIVSASKAENEVYKSKKDVYERALSMRQKQTAEIKLLEAKLPKTTTGAPDVNKRNNAQAQLRRLNERKTAVSSTIAVLEKDIATFQKMLANLGSSKCPLSDKLVCTTDKTAIQEELEEQVRLNQAEIDKLKNEMSDIASKIKMFEKQIEDFNAENDKYQAANLLSSQIKALRAALVDLPPVPVEPKSSSDADAKIRILNEEKAAVMKYMLAEENGKKIPVLESRMNTIQELVTALNPKGGVREKIISHALAPLVAHINTRASELKLDIDIDIRVDKGSHIFCKTFNSGDFIPFESASSGQRAIVLYLFLDMLNALSGFGVLFLDGLEVLDANAFDSLLTVLESADADKTYDHIFVASVNHEDVLDVLKKHTAWTQIPM